MQFHLNGFRPGNPEILEDCEEPLPGSDSLASETDVLIIGCGPAGLTLATQLSKYSSVKTVIVDQKPGPLKLGQADGVACRTMEMFEAFSFSEKVLKEAYWVNETTFWKPSHQNEQEIVRSSRIQDTEDGLSEFPHVILNQARVHDHLLEKMYNAPFRIQPNYKLKLIDLKVDDGPNMGVNESYPVMATFQETDNHKQKKTHKVKSQFVVGCDGARSSVRDFLKIKLKGDSANQIWGVMDVLAISDFPDIRFKSVVHSSHEGNLLIIPREGGYLVRLYIELDKLKEDERLSSKDIKIETLITSAKRILNPYQFEVKEVAWWSVYEIGQRLAERFDDLKRENKVPRGFIVGDSCHTHSPKAGQGMNVAMADSFNLGWKLGSVLAGQCSPDILKTYSEERRQVASQLIEFDKEFARMFSARPKSTNSNNDEEIDPKEFEKYFKKYGRFTAGTETKYSKSLITGSSECQDLARGFKVGKRFHSAPVVRAFDAKPIQLGHTLKADGRWRLFIFSDRNFSGQEDSKVHSLCKGLSELNNSLIKTYTQKGLDIDSVFDVRAIFQMNHRDFNHAWLPSLLMPYKGKYNLIDYEKVFCPNFKLGEDIFEMRGINKEEGCVVIVRPDHHVSKIFRLESVDSIRSFFEEFMVIPKG